MKKNPILLVLATTAALTSLSAQDLRENAFFKSLAGTWKGQGQLTFEGQKPRPMQNRIKAAFDAAGALFTIEGALVLGEEDGTLSAKPTLYRWEIRRSEKSPDRFDGRMIPLDNESEADTYEVSVDEASGTARFVQISTGGEDRMELTKQVKGADYVSRTTVYNSAGARTATAEMKFAREPSFGKAEK